MTFRKEDTRVTNWEKLETVLKEFLLQNGENGEIIISLQSKNDCRHIFFYEETCKKDAKVQKNRVTGNLPVSIDDKQAKLMNIPEIKMLFETRENNENFIERLSELVVGAQDREQFVYVLKATIQVSAVSNIVVWSDIEKVLHSKYNNYKGYGRDYWATTIKMRFSKMGYEMTFSKFLSLFVDMMNKEEIKKELKKKTSYTLYLSPSSLESLSEISVLENFLKSLKKSCESKNNIAKGLLNFMGYEDFTQSVMQELIVDIEIALDMEKFSVKEWNDKRVKFGRKVNDNAQKMADKIISRWFLNYNYKCGLEKFMKLLNKEFKK